MSTDRHPRLSSARLLKNLHHRAAKFKVKKCWAQSHRVIPRWVSRFRRSDPLVIKASGRIHSWKFVQINFRNWSSSVINGGAQAHSRGTSESELYLLTSSRTHHTTTVTTQSEHVIPLTLGITPIASAKIWALNKESHACDKAHCSFWKWA